MSGVSADDIAHLDLRQDWEQNNSDKPPIVSNDARAAGRDVDRCQWSSGLLWRETGCLVLFKTVTLTFINTAARGDYYRSHQ
jgi:hypothetical protein